MSVQTATVPPAVVPQWHIYPPPLVRVRDLTKQFTAHGRTRTVFEGFNCDVEERSFVSIIGPSGCGKSTLLKIMAGLEPATSGGVTFKEQPVVGPPRGVIYVFQQYTKSIFPWRTVLGNVAFGLEHLPGLGRKERVERCRAYLRLVGLDGYEAYYPSQLSGGMQQRVAIARALICQPAVLMMDEPFSAVDALTRASLQQLLLSIWASIPITIVFVTHDVDEAVFLSERVISLGGAPATVEDEVAVDLPHPRDQLGTRGRPEFIALRERLLSRVLAPERDRAAEPCAEHGVTAARSAP